MKSSAAKFTKRCWLIIGFLMAVVLAGVLTALSEPTHIVRGLLTGEPFHRERPTSYWREVLRHEGQDGQLSWETVSKFRRNAETAVPVLIGCARDPDRNVRWPAIDLLRQGNFRSQRVLETLIAALDDGDSEVRLQAIIALSGWSKAARQAIPALSACLQDPEPQVAHYADLALWHIDLPAAAAAIGWKPFRSADWQFSVSMPAEPKYEQHPSPVVDSVTIHGFTAWRGPNAYGVAVSEYPEDFIKSIAEEDRVATGLQMILAITGGNVQAEGSLIVQGRKGYERLIEVEEKGLLRQRVFWVGSRCYLIQVAGAPKFWNAKAGDYFMESFHFEDGPKDRPALP